MAINILTTVIPYTSIFCSLLSSNDHGINRDWSSSTCHHADFGEVVIKINKVVSNSGMVSIENQRKVDVILRALMFVFSLVGVVVMVSSKQSERIPVSPVMMIRVDAKFTHSASFTYYVSAFSVLGLYSMITGYLSYSTMKKQERISTGQLLQLLLLDTFLLGIAASATGAGGGVAYEALKGNPHIHWMKICNIFDKFCDHLAASGVMAVLASSMLVLLIWTSAGAIARNAGR